MTWPVYKAAIAVKLPIANFIHILFQAAQKVNSHQFTTTTITISVQVKSLHPPQFKQPAYEAIITAAGAMAMDMNNKDQPLRIVATDDDYTATGVNTYICLFITTWM